MGDSSAQNPYLKKGVTFRKQTNVLKIVVPAKSEKDQDLKLLYRYSPGNL